MHPPPQERDPIDDPELGRSLTEGSFLDGNAREAGPAPRSAHDADLAWLQRVHDAVRPRPGSWDREAMWAATLKQAGLAPVAGRLRRAQGKVAPRVFGWGWFSKGTLQNGFFLKQTLRGTIASERRTVCVPKEAHIVHYRWLRAMIAAMGVASLAIIAGRWWQARPSMPMAATIYRTRTAERVTVTLADGNQVTLAPQSTLAVQDSHATLTGEALFTITHHRDVPFVVQAGLVTIRVLGTAFDVRHYAEERDTRVAVTDGKVELRTGSRRRRIIPMPAGRVALVSDSAVILANDVTDVTCWTTGQLVFTKAPVRDVLSAVGHWYGYTFRLAGRDSLVLTQQHVTVVLDERSVTDAMRILGGLLNATATVDSTGPGIPIITLHVGPSAGAGAATAPERRDLRDAFTTIREKGR